MSRTHQFGLLTAIIVIALGSSILSAGTIIPERYNQGPRILFNTENDMDKLDEIVPDQLFQKHWQGPRVTVQHVFFTKNDQGKHVKITRPGGFHGEEVVMMLSGTLRFTFPDTGEAYDISTGDVFHFPNVLHFGGCISDTCHIVVVYTPNRADFGPEGSEMTVQSNIGLAE